MIYALAAFTPAVVVQASDSPIISTTHVTPDERLLSTPAIHPTPASEPATDFQQMRSLSAALAESMLGTSTPAETLAQGGTKPSLETEPSIPNQQPFQPQNVPLQVWQQTARRTRSAPGISILTPSAYGQSWGSASIGLGWQERTRFTEQSDAVLGIGFGLGDAQNSVGLDVGLTFVDLIGNTARDGTVSLKLHRRLPDDFAVAVGVKNLIRYGDTDSGTGYYGVVTKRFRLQEDVAKPFSQLYLSAGVGSGQFRSELDINSDRNSLGVFGSVALRVAEPISAIAEWSGQDLTLGLSIAPLRNMPLVITPAVTDITGSAGDGNRFILGVGYGFSF
ncbi:MAG: hypothetical protein Fur006_09560 [Coleofasciculaceae cyanobacterium]